MAYLSQVNNYAQTIEQASITILPGLRYTVLPNRELNPAILPPATNTINTFISQCKHDNSDGTTDFFAHKVELAEDKTNLLTVEIQTRHYLLNTNLAGLYQEILMIDRWRLQRPYPENYSRDATWLQLNQMEFKVREQIRREMKEGFNDISFQQKDLREAALEFKVKQQKSKMLDMGELEQSLENEEVLTI